MKTIAKVLESMLSKPATPTWVCDDLQLNGPQASSPVPGVGPVSLWTWGG